MVGGPHFPITRKDTMKVKSIESVRTFTVAAPGYEFRPDSNAGGMRPWLQSEVEAQHEDAAVRVAMAEWAEAWPTLRWPRQLEVTVLQTHRPDGTPTRTRFPNRKLVKIG